VANTEQGRGREHRVSVLAWACHGGDSEKTAVFRKDKQKTEWLFGQPNRHIKKVIKTVIILMVKVDKA
jgi:hypothetical protein